MKMRCKVAVAAGVLLSVSLVAGVAGAEVGEEEPAERVVSQEQQGEQEVRSETAPQGAQEARAEATSGSEGGDARQEAERSETRGPERETGEETQNPEDVEPARESGSVEESEDGPDPPDEPAGPGGDISSAATERAEQHAQAGNGRGEQSPQRSSSDGFFDESSGIPPERAAEIEARIQEIVRQVEEIREEAEARRQDSSEPRERPADRDEEERAGASGPESRPAPPPATSEPASEDERGGGPGAVEQRERSTGAERGERAGSPGGQVAPARAAAETQLRELQAEARTGELPQPATGVSPANRQQELGIARDRITAREVDEIPLREYEELYREAAEEYGFEEDWYILAAVGKVESDHGQNLGPSSAGALGPMQFLPSTWEEFAVDGNDNGRKNIMDPEDAIPGAANYLSESGAPDDWYGALFTYNRADWYVRKVLDVAEGYRQLAEDDSVGPYPRLAPPR